MSNPAPLRPAAARYDQAVGWACFAVLIVYGLLIDLKGVTNDEAARLYMMNGGLGYGLNAPAAYSSWKGVMAALNPYAYQPLYYLLQNTVMTVAHSHNVILLRLVNLFFLWVGLRGLLALSTAWRLAPRLFLLGAFSLNAYLIMHVLQLREYMLGIAFYIWSTWLVLRLDASKADPASVRLPWFIAYGLLLAAGFYVQTWAVLPAVGQFLFLVLSRRGWNWRFFAKLAVSYAVVLACTVPYLRSHPQRVFIGRWGTEGTALWPQLYAGFHVVVSGSEPGVSGFTDFLFWLWLLLIASVAALLAHNKLTQGTPVPVAELGRQARLMGLCTVVAVAFQIGYFYKTDDLSVSVRYFAIHYFFLTWLVVLAFKGLHDLACDGAGSQRLRRGLKFAVAAVLTVLVGSCGWQVRTFYRNPYYDMDMPRTPDWPRLMAGLSRVLEPNDTVLTRNFIHATAVNFTRPIANPVVSIQDLPAGAPPATGRFLYLETALVIPARPTLVAQLKSLGFATMRDAPFPAADGQGEIPGWRILIFTR